MDEVQLDKKLAEQEIPGEDKWLGHDWEPILSRPPFVPEAQEGILEEAARITSGDRQRDYDHPSENHKRIADLWNAYLGVRKNPLAEIEPADVAYMMILLKIARDVYTPKRDNAVDICGYARCVARIRGWEP